MSDRLKGKRAVVTAAAAGIGRACAIAFAREGATVIATASRPESIAWVRELGADQVVDYTRDDFTRSGRRCNDRMTDVVVWTSSSWLFGLGMFFISCFTSLFRYSSGLCSGA